MERESHAYLCISHTSTQSSRRIKIPQTVLYVGYNLIITAISFFLINHDLPQRQYIILYTYIFM